MLDDRYYMRRSSFDFRRSATVILLLLLGVAFILQLTLLHYTRFPTWNYLALSVEGMRHGYVWQLLTYQFLHGGWLHLLLNCWAIYIFGKEVEEVFGRARFLLLYFSSGILGGLLQLALGGLFHGPYAGATVGASAGAFGLVAAFATLYPERVLTLLLFFIIPVSMRAKFLLLFSGIITVLGLVFPSDNIAHAAHLGGMLTGVLFVRYAAQWSWRWPRLRSLSNRSPGRLVKVRSQGGNWRAARDERELPPDEFLSKEVDPILDKISALGIHSLTERERRILQTARDRIPKH
jgi:membrane associated rhomboid family serine protease